MSKGELMCVCPGCGAYGGLEAFAAGVDASVVASLLGRAHPDVAQALQRYLSLFRSSQRRNTWARARKVIEQLLPLIEAERINYSGRDWTVPRSLWISAISSMVDSTTIQRPLRNHNYLFKILAEGADRTEAKQEVASESTRRAEQLDRVGGSPVSVGSLSVLSALATGKAPDLEPAEAEAQLQRRIGLALTELAAEVAVRQRMKETLAGADLLLHLVRRGHEEFVARRALERFGEVGGA